MPDDADLVDEIRSWSDWDHHDATVAVASYADELVESGQARSRVDVLRAMPSELAVPWRIWMLDIQVQNGGYFQYFWNGYSDVAEDTANDLDLIGARGYAENQRSAVAAFSRVADQLSELSRRGFAERSHLPYQDGLAVFDFHEHDEAWDRLEADDPLMEVAGRWLEEHRDPVISAIEATSAR